MWKKTYFLLASCQPLTKKAGFVSVSQWYGSADPDRTEMSRSTTLDGSKYWGWWNVSATGAGLSGRSCGGLQQTAGGSAVPLRGSHLYRRHAAPRVPPRCRCKARNGFLSSKPSGRGHLSKIKGDNCDLYPSVIFCFVFAGWARFQVVTELTKIYRNKYL